MPLIYRGQKYDSVAPGIESPGAVPACSSSLSVGDDVVLKGRPVRLSEVTLKRARLEHDKIYMRGKCVLTDEIVSDWVSAVSSEKHDVLAAHVERARGYVVRVTDATHVTVRTVGPTRSIPAGREVVKALLELPSQGADRDVLIVKAPVVTGEQRCECCSAVRL